MKKIFITSFLALLCFSASAQFKVNSNGNSNVPTYKSFYIGNFGDSNNRMRFYSSSSYAIFDYYPDLYFRSGSSTSLPTRVIFKSTGNVGISNSSPSYRLDVNGDVRATSFITSSDARLKKNVVPLSNALTKLNSLNGVKYNYRNDITVKRISPIDDTSYEEPVVDVKEDRVKLGLIAQNVAEVLPELVYEDQDGYLGVDYVALIPVLIEAIKDQQVQINSLKEEIAKVK